MTLGTLLSRIRATASQAKELGTLKSIETSSTLLSSTSSSPPFLVRVVENLARKDDATARQGPATGTAHDPTASAPPKPSFNPFLPYDKSMYVQDVGPAHVLLLNKFNVVEDHVLVVTKDFEEQSSLLNAADFAAMWQVLREVDGLAFYNAGQVAGASQRHKHLQVIGGKVGDLPDGLGVAPFDQALTHSVSEHAGVDPFRTNILPFLHLAVRMDDVASVAEDTAQSGDETMKRYVQLLRAGEPTAHSVSKIEGSDDSMERQPYSYNLLVTRRWMLLVPRRRECYGKVSVNSMGFAGCLLVRDEEHMNVVKDNGGMAVLKHVAFSE